LIIALVVLVLVAIGIVVRLLIAELSKPARAQVKTIRNPAYIPAGMGVAASDVLVGAGVGGLGAAEVAGGGPGAYVAGPVAGGGYVIPGQTVGVPTRSRRSRRMRMRDVVERGEGVRISIWRRMRSFVSLLVLMALLGTGAAAVIGGIVLLVAFVLEQAVN
jgi:hypothetical protein